MSQVELDLSALEGADRVAVIGVGSEMRGDDAAGVEVVRKLGEQLDSPRVLLVDTGIVPENFGSKIEQFKPSHVIIVDAVALNLEPGAVRMVDPGTIVGETMSTHKLPLSMFIEYLQEQTGAEVLMIGIQPAKVGLGEKMSGEIKKAAGELAGTLAEKLGSL